MVNKGRCYITGSSRYFIVACLAHDIGYIRGIVKGDDAKGYVVDGTGCRADLPILRLRHIMLSGRSCLCWIALCQARSSTLQELRVRSDSQSADENEIDEEGALLRAADLIGQLGDPHYLRKANHRPFRNKELQGRRARCHEMAMARPPPRILRSQAHVIVLPGLRTASHLFASHMTRLTPTATQSIKINSQSIIERP